MKCVRLGMIVGYKPTPTEMGEMREHRANCNIREDLPAVVVAVWGEDLVNLKVLLDGKGDQWATSVHRGGGVGEWDFYPEEVATDVPAAEENAPVSAEVATDVPAAEENAPVSEEVPADEPLRVEPKSKSRKGGKEV